MKAIAVNQLDDEFKPNGEYMRLCATEEPHQVVKDIIARLKKEEGITYAEAYGILQTTKRYLEYEANFLKPITLEKEL